MALLFSAFELLHLTRHFIETQACVMFNYNYISEHQINYN